MKNPNRNSMEYTIKHNNIRKKDIAVIGLSCRFPKANNQQEFWENLKATKSSIEEIPTNRWDWKRYFGDPRGKDYKSNSKWGGFIEDIDKFS